MFDTECWNSARIGVLFAHETQTSANWPRPHRFARLQQLTLHLKPNWLTEMISARANHRYPAQSWWDYKVCGSARFPLRFNTFGLCKSIFFKTCLQVNGCDEDQDFGGYALEFIAGE